MSKQSEAKKNQGYHEKPVPMTCANCVNYESEKKKRCGIGGFAVKKTATCDYYIDVED